MHHREEEVNTGKKRGEKEMQTQLQLMLTSLFHSTVRASQVEETAQTNKQQHKNTLRESRQMTKLLLSPSSGSGCNSTSVQQTCDRNYF